MAFVGEIKLIPYDDIPVGFLECNGQSLKVSDYKKLFMMIGTKYGKPDEVHFCLPNLQAPKGMIYCIAFDGDVPEI